MHTDVDVLIPARAGSKGLPDKNGRILVDRPLFLHSVECARRLPFVDRVLVSTDSADLARCARDAGAHVPELRPAHLAEDDSPMADVVRYAVEVFKSGGHKENRFILLLDPTSPLRKLADLLHAYEVLAGDSSRDGAIAVSTPPFNPLWVGVELNAKGRIGRHPLCERVFTRRQDVPTYMRINGSFYLWRNNFAANLMPDWLDRGDFIGIETAEILSHSIDTEDDFRLVELLLAHRIVDLPWLSETQP